jgi:hypothetical protein
LFFLHYLRRYHHEIEERKSEFAKSQSVVESQNALLEEQANITKKNDEVIKYMSKKSAPVPSSVTTTPHYQTISPNSLTSTRDMLTPSSAVNSLPGELSIEFNIISYLP